MLLAMTLAFSAVCAGIAMAVGISPMMSLVMTIGAFITLFVVQKKLIQHLVYTGVCIHRFNGCIAGYSSLYLGVAGGQIMEALGATALVFFAIWLRVTTEGLLIHGRILGSRPSCSACSCYCEHLFRSSGVSNNQCSDCIYYVRFHLV